MTRKNNIETRAVPTTILTIDREAIDWDLLNQHCHIVRYKMPYRSDKDFNYYPRMHNWYKQTSEHPCYLHKIGYLYVN